jgi:alpha-1,2-mannosyltransferase
VTIRNAPPPPPRGSSPPERPFPPEGPVSPCLPPSPRWPPWRGLPSRGQPHPVRAAFLKRPASLPAQAAQLIASLAAVTFFLLSYSPRGVGFGLYHIDLDVYRIGGRTWLHGGNLYGRLPPTQAGVALPFTYPPVAAALLAPFSLVPMTVAATALTLATIGLLAMVLRMFLRRVAGPAARSPWALAWLLPPALFLEPVRDTLGFGQVNVVLVALDCLTGLAAAVKLTPAAFVLFFLVQRDRRAACTTAASFAAVTAIGFAVAWHDSVRYWTGVVFQTGRVGNLDYASNQSILAVLARAGLDPHSPAGMAIWLALSAIAVALACRGMRYAFAASEDCMALSLNAFAALLISPVSWSHHWVWCAPALLTLTEVGGASAPKSQSLLTGEFAVGAGHECGGGPVDAVDDHRVCGAAGADRRNGVLPAYAQARRPAWAARVGGGADAAVRGRHDRRCIDHLAGGLTRWP